MAVVSLIDLLEKILFFFSNKKVSSWIVVLFAGGFGSFLL